MTEWQRIHSYNRLVRQGRTAPLLCPDDNTVYGYYLAENDDPALWCPSCNSRVTMGINLWDQINAVLREHGKL